MAKDRTPDARRGSGGSSRDARGGSSARGSSAAGRSGGKGRTRPPTQVVTQPRRPWGLIAAALAVVVFAVAAIGYALVQVNRAEANDVDSADEIDGLETFDTGAATHVPTPVDYPQSPPVGGNHDAQWADCTGTVYDVDIRHENAVHSLEHGAVWITYNPDEVSEADIETLSALVDGQAGRMLSPYVGLDAPVSVQSWNRQLKVESADDPRLDQFADFFASNPESPEPGASCENGGWLTSPLLEESDGQVPADDTGTPAPSSEAPSSEAAEPSEPAEPSDTATE